MTDAKAKYHELRRRSCLSRGRDAIHRVYTSSWIQSLMVLIIIANFVVSISEAELRYSKDGVDRRPIFEVIEIIFTSIFTLEFLVVMVSGGPLNYFKDSWNIMDVTVVIVSITALFVKDGPGFSLLRLVRIFRVVRVVRQLTSLRRIVNALAASMVPMLSAFSVLFLVTAIYAIVAVDLFGEQNPVFFGTFTSSLFTMFQVCTFDSWGSIAREDDGTVTTASAIFFVSYVIVVGWVIQNVVVAVLLDEFVESVTKDRNEEIEKLIAQENKHKQSLGSPLDPLLQVLSSFSTSTDLSARIRKIFDLIDLEGVGSVAYEDFTYGLRQLNFTPPIHLSFDDFTSMVRDHDANLSTGKGGILNSAGRMEISGFEGLMRAQLHHYVQRHTSQAMQGAAASGSAIGHVLFALKLLNTTVEDINANLERKGGLRLVTGTEALTSSDNHHHSFKKCVTGGAGEPAPKSAHWTSGTENKGQALPQIPVLPQIPGKMQRLQGLAVAGIGSARNGSRRQWLQPPPILRTTTGFGFRVWCVGFRVS
jgi:voltage-gated sodium channel